MNAFPNKSYFLSELKNPFFWFEFYSVVGMKLITEFLLPNFLGAEDPDLAVDVACISDDFKSDFIGADCSSLFYFLIIFQMIK